MAREFIVTREWSVIAYDAESAARRAWELMCLPEDMLSIVGVRDTKTGEAVDVDLNALEGV